MFSPCAAAIRRSSTIGLIFGPRQTVGPFPTTSLPCWREEFVERHGRQSIRYVIVGTKTDSSERRVPLPTSLLPDLPSQIGRPLFEGPSQAAGKRLMRFIRQIGISDPRKT